MSVLFKNPTCIKLPHLEKPLEIFGEIKGGEVVALQGPSGCGKSSLLNSLAGVDTSAPRYLLNNEEVHTLLHGQRKLSLVFQKPLLFPHMSVLENIEFPLRFKEPWKTWSFDLKRKHSLQILKTLNLEDLAQRSVAQLSGGESMRISLVRSLISEPQFLMLDEAFAALDKNTKDAIKLWLKNLITKQKIATLMVTHLDEDMANFADRALFWPSDNSTIHF